MARLNGIAVRVPLLNASLTDCVFEVKRDHDRRGGQRRCFQAAADGPLKGILGYEERPLVSIDFKDDPRSAIVDAPSTMVVDETQVKILAWYDNEWGYVNRMVELARKVARSLPHRLMARYGSLADSRSHGMATADALTPRSRRATSATTCSSRPPTGPTR